MVPFVFLMLMPIISQHLRIKGVRYQKKTNFALSLYFLMLTLLIMLRHESIGNDTRNYISIFNRIGHLDWDDLGGQDLEIGYAIFNKVVSVFVENPQVYLAIAAIIVAVMIYPTYKRLCLDASLTIVLFSFLSTFVMMFSGLRQMIAIAIGFIAYDFVREKKVVPFFVTVLLAMSFHVSAFMLAFMYPLYHAKITRKWLYVIVPVVAVIFMFNRPVFSILTVILTRFTRFEGAMESTGAYTMLILFALFTVFCFLIPDNSRLDAEAIGLRNFLLLSLVIQLFAPLHMLAMRMNYYYIIFIPLLLPKIIQCRSKRWNQVAILGRHVMVAFFLVYFFFNASRGGNLHVFPYHFFWENV